jgi:Protein of unknown function (DUF1275)
MGIQSVAARQDGRPGVTTVVFTSTLTAIVIALTGAVLGSPRRLSFVAKRQIFMFLAYGLGAVTGGFFTWHALDAILPAAAGGPRRALPASGIRPDKPAPAGSVTNTIPLQIDSSGNPLKSGAWRRPPRLRHDGVERRGRSLFHVGFVETGRSTGLSPSDRKPGREPQGACARFGWQKPV